MAGFEEHLTQLETVVERLERGRQPRAPLTVRPTIIGSAVRP